MYLLLAQNLTLDCHGCFELWLRRDILSSRYGAILFFSLFLKLLDCCWIVFLLPQGTNWAIQRSATKQTDADEMRGSSFHWYLVSNNPDDVFANATDEQQRRWGWSLYALPNGRVSKFLATALLPPLSTLSTAACVLSFFLETASELFLLPLFSQLISSLYAF